MVVGTALGLGISQTAARLFLNSEKGKRFIYNNMNSMPLIASSAGIIATALTYEIFTTGFKRNPKVIAAVVAAGGVAAFVNWFLNKPENQEGTVVINTLRNSHKKYCYKNDQSIPMKWFTVAQLATAFAYEKSRGDEKAAGKILWNNVVVPA